MLKNYFKIAWRNIWKHKVFSAINITGLTIGTVAFLLIMQYVSFKLSYDQFHGQANDIYRVVNDRYQNGELVQHGTITYSAVSKAMYDDFPEVINYTRMVPYGPLIVINQQIKMGDQLGFAVENSFLQMFDFDFISGDTKSALENPYSIILTESLAKKLFNGIEKKYDTIVGQSITLQNEETIYTVTGVCNDVPENSHLDFDFLISYNTLYSDENAWAAAEYDFRASDFWHYIQLEPGTDFQSLEAKLPDFSQRHFRGNEVSGSMEKFYLQPLPKAHLYSDFEYEIGQTGSATVVWGLLIIALFIIVIAWVNYINLATAQSIERAKEVGIKKVIGGKKSQLILQFLIESTLINMIALALAIIMVVLLQSGFNNLLQINLSLTDLFNNSTNGYVIFITLAGFLIFGIILSGIYPAFVLSSFKPMKVLKGKIGGRSDRFSFRKGLVVAQFCITVVLIIGSVVVLQQLTFMNSRELGFNPDQVMTIEPPVLTRWDSTFIDRVNSFKEDIKQLSHVKEAATSWAVPGAELSRSFDVRQLDSASTNRITVRHTSIDYDYLKVYEIDLIAGRNFVPSDHNANWERLHSIMINQSTAKLLGFSSPEDAIGKSILRGDRRWNVVGVIDDYHQKSLRYPMEPSIFFPGYSNYSTISVKISPSDISQTIEDLKKKYEEFFPGNLFAYEFLDQHYQSQYENEQLFSRVFAIFSGLAILVACMGLFGLAMFSTIQRTKEVGVRKVMGATVSNILVLVSMDFIKLVVVASLIAFPIAWWVMDKWLQDFSYKITISWWVFAFSGGLAILIALLTVSTQALKAAVSNPVNSLRTE